MDVGSAKMAGMSTFRRLLANALVSGVMSSFLWFAVTFWVYLETRSVVATSVIGGAFAIFSAIAGMLFGTFVDRHRKHTAMVVASVAALTMYGLAALQYALVPTATLLRLGSPHFWLFVALVLAGSVAGNLRAIALSTSVTLLVPEERRDRANGMVGTVVGVSFSITSVASGLVIGRLGMGWALALALGITAAALADLLTIRVDEPRPEGRTGDRRQLFDFAGAMHAIREVPGLLGMVMFAAFNNLLGGVFMSLIDAYGLSLVSVETWGILFAVLSGFFILGGLVVSRRGLGARPMRVILFGNLVELGGVRVVHAALIDRHARDRDGRVDGVDAGDRGGRADGAAERRPVRSPGTGLRFRTDRRELRVAAHRLRHRPARPVRDDPVDDRRSRRRCDRRLVRHRPRARPRTDLHARRDDRHRSDAHRARVALVPAARSPDPRLVQRR